MSFQSRRIRDDKPAVISSSWKQSAFFLLAMLGPLVRLYARLKAHNHAVEDPASDGVMLRRGFTIVSALAIVILIVLGSMKTLAFMKDFSPLQMLTASTGASPKTDASGFTNILLLGVGDADHDGIDLTDSMMVASIDPKTKSIAMISLPRDLYLTKSQKIGIGRINSLYRDYKDSLIHQGMKKEEASTEALNQLAIELGSLMGVDIHGVVKINFSGFAKAIDAIGGIDIVVPEDLVDPEYPGPNYTYETFSITAGPHHLDGETALKYVRSRHSTSDFSRSGRQQQIIAAVAQKLKDNGFIGKISNISRLYSILSTNIESTFSLPELIGLAGMEKKIDTKNVISMQLSDQNGLYSTLSQPGGLLYAPPRDQFAGASVLLPVTNSGPIGNWSQISFFIDLLLHHRDWYLNNVHIAVLNSSTKVGMARRVGTDLVRYGFDVVSTQNYEQKNVPTSFIIENPHSTDEKADATVKAREVALDDMTAFFSKKLAISDIRHEVTVSRDESPDIVIVTGQDFEYKPLSQTGSGSSNAYAR